MSRGGEVVLLARNEIQSTFLEQLVVKPTWGKGNSGFGIKMLHMRLLMKMSAQSIKMNILAWIEG